MEAAFVFEYAFYAASSVSLLHTSLILGALFLGAVFHLFNSNSFLRFTKKNPFDVRPGCAGMMLIGFILVPPFAGGVL